MTNGLTALGPDVPAFVPMDLAISLTEVQVALRKLAVIGRLQAAERRRLSDDHTASRREVVDAWYDANDLLDRAIQGLTAATDALVPHVRAAGKAFHRRQEVEQD